jgi:hypothetical protein
MRNNDRFRGSSYCRQVPEKVRALQDKTREHKPGRDFNLELQEKDRYQPHDVVVLGEENKIHVVVSLGEWGGK